MTARGGALLVVIAAAYIYLCAGHIDGGDNAEFATLGAVGGVAHPSGYPLYVLWLRALSWLPGPPAHAAALATAVLAVAALAALHAACRAWGARPAAASVAVALYAAAPIAVRMSTEAEVFALNTLVVAVVVWLAAAHGPARGALRALLLGLVAGLGLANNMTCALVAPIGVLGVVRGIREVRAAAGASSPADLARRGAIAALLATAGLAIGLSPYGYLFLAPHNAASWGDIRSLSDAWDVILRRDYGGPTSMSAVGAHLPVAANELALAVSLLRAWWYVPALLGLVTLVAHCVRAPVAADAPSGKPASVAPIVARESRAGWIALAASFMLAGPVLVSRFNLEPRSVFLAIVARFHVLPAELLAIPVAVGFTRIAARLAPGRSLRPAVGAAAAIAVFAAALAIDLPRLAVARSSIVEAGVENTLLALPPRAVLVVSPDDLVFGVRYAQLALHERPDVTLIARRFGVLPWYRARAAAAGVPLDAPPGALADAVLASGRPLVVDALEDDMLAARPHYPLGGVFVVLPRGAAVPPLDEIVARNRELFLQRFALASTPTPDDDWAAEAYSRYARTWAELGELLEAAGRADEAGRAYGLASQLHPHD